MNAARDATPAERRIRTITTILLLVIAVGTPVAAAREWLVSFQHPDNPVDPFTDANTYLAAGERLNAGHALFARVEGDRAVFDEARFPAALLSPPPIAALWRPIAALPLGFQAWVIACWVALVGTIAYLVLKIGLPAALLSLALFVPTSQQLAVANVAAFFPAVLVIAWRFRNTPWPGIGIGLISAVKFSPIAVTGWMVGRRMWRMLGVTAITIGILGLVGGIGAGFGSYVEYLRIAPQIQPTPISIAGLTGVPWASYAVLLGGTLLAAIVGLRRSGLSFGISVVALTFGTPVLYASGLVPLLAILAPLIPDPVPSRNAATDAARLQPAGPLG